MSQFQASEGVVTSLAWPITPGNFVRIFPHLRRICVQLFTLSHFVLSFTMKITVHFCAAIIIRHRVFCTLQVTFSRLHINSIAFRAVINAVIITIIIRQYHCTNTIGILCITSVLATHPWRPPGTKNTTVTRTVSLYLSDTRCQYSQKNAIRNRKPTSTGFQTATWTHLYHIIKNIRSKVTFISEIHSDR